MSNTKYRVSGRVIEQTTRGGISGLRVEAWDKDTKYHDMLGVGFTDQNGRFMISFDETYFGDHLDRLPDLFFKIFRDETLIKCTAGSTLMNVKSKDKEVVLAVDLPTDRATGKDRVNTEQLLNAIDFFRKSDFHATLGDMKDKLGIVRKILFDIVKQSFTKEIKPVRPSGVATRTIINQDIATVESDLAARQIRVNKIKPYDPTLRKEYFQAITMFPMTLKAGDNVNLYEKDGRVLYYSIEKKREPADINAADVARLDDEVADVRSNMRNISAVTNQIESIKSTAEENRVQLVAEIMKGEEQSTTIEKMKADLEKAKQESKKKEEIISVLRQEIDSLSNSQKELISKISPDRIAKMEHDIKKLMGVKQKTIKPFIKGRRRLHK